MSKLFCWTVTNSIFSARLSMDAAVCLISSLTCSWWLPSSLWIAGCGITVPFRPIVHITHHKTSWTELIWLSSRITRTREHPQNWDCSKIAGIKKKLGALRQIYEHFGQKIRSVTHHHRPWTSVPVNYVHHASQGVNNRSKRYSISDPLRKSWKCPRCSWRWIWIWLASWGP